MSINKKAGERKVPLCVNEEKDDVYVGMKWHNFLVKYALYAAAVINLVIGILQLTGLRYTLNSYFGNAIMIKEEMHFYYPPLKFVDAIFYITLFCMAVYQVLIRNMLKRGYRHSVRHLNTMICIMCTVYALYDFLFQAFVRTEVYVRAMLNYSSPSVTALTGAALAVGLSLWNCWYYKNRRHIFKKKAE